MKINIGDKVIISKEKANQGSTSWYSNKIFTITKIDGNDVVELDKNLSEKHSNKININYLKLLNIERKNKLLNLESLNIFGS